MPIVAVAVPPRKTRLPGVGATLTAFVSYTEAKRWSADRGSFGRGNLEGVIASETANNAATGATMIPLLALGLPGGALTAMMVSVFQMHDIDPGPLVFIMSPDLIWIIFAAILFANILILFLGFVEARMISVLIAIPKQYLIPTIIVLATIGAYANRGLIIDVGVMFICGIAGYLMKRNGYSVTATVLGLILGGIGEKTFAQAMQILHYDVGAFLARPICLVFVLLSVLSIARAFHRSTQALPDPRPAIARDPTP